MLASCVLRADGHRSGRAAPRIKASLHLARSDFDGRDLLTLVDSFRFSLLSSIVNQPAGAARDRADCGAFSAAGQAADSCSGRRTAADDSSRLLLGSSLGRIPRSDHCRLLVPELSGCRFALPQGRLSIRSTVSGIDSMRRAAGAVVREPDAGLLRCYSGWSAGTRFCCAELSRAHPAKRTAA